MEEFPFHWLVLLIVLLLVLSILVPISKILQRMGFNGAWCLIYFVPVANIIALWVVAYTPWPASQAPVKRD